jgi:multiple sugar transport system permease protein
MTLQAALGRFLVYAVLSIGAIAMFFPFYWMLSTSLKTRQEAGTSTPILVPHKMQPANWVAAWQLGEQGNPGLKGALFGGWEPGQQLTFTVTVLESEPGAGVDIVIPKPSGVIRFPLGDETQAESSYLGATDDGEASSYRITLTHAGTTSFQRLPLELRLPRSSQYLSGTLAADGERNTRNYQQVTFDNISPGLLSYVFSNYVSAWRAAPFGWYFFNSAFTAMMQVLAGLVVASLAAFALARIPFWGRELVFIGVIGTLMIPGEVLLIPNYVTLARLGWINSYPALIVPFVASAFGIFLLRQFFLTLPQELFDAARMDGASWFTQLHRVALPLALPGLVTYALFSFLGSWNALLWPLIVTSSERMRTIQVGLRYFVDEAGTDYGALMAASMLAVLPVIIGFLFVQKQFIQGIARSGLK